MSDAVGVLLFFLGLWLIDIIIRLFNPPLEPPEDEWEKWSKL